MSRIDWVIANCRLLAAIGDELEESQPFAGLTIGTGILWIASIIGLGLLLKA
jgi:adenosylhomocysteinase